MSDASKTVQSPSTTEPTTTTSNSTSSSSSAGNNGSAPAFKPFVFSFSTPASFSNAVPVAKADEEEDGGDEDVEAEAAIEFAPQIAVSDRVEANLNEEHEEELLKDKAKLFRWDKPSGQWKERGSGDVKILKHKESHKVRILMRRDQTLKICANHYITKNMKLQENKGSDKAWSYAVTADFSEEVPSKELFCIKLKSKESAAQWKQVFDKAAADSSE
eukprot:ANDGO_04320.mRNA.1 Ran-specific GTPase-activating protein 1